MELRHLRYFVAVAEELHFGRAAQRLSIAQPPLSQQIRQLEDELGFRLFERSRTFVRLTVSGRAFLERVVKILADLDDSVSFARAVDTGRLNELRVGNVGTPHRSLLDAAKTFSSRHPEVKVGVTEFTLGALLRAVREERIDLGCFRQWMINPPPHAVVIGETALSVALPRSNRLSRGKTVPLHALAELPFVSLDRELAPGYHERLIAACAAAGFVPDIVQSVPGTTSMLHYVATGEGVAIVAHVELKHPQVVYRRIVEPEIYVPTLALRSSRSTSPLVAEFLGLLARPDTRRVSRER
jgi:DNA-binding transcriptional LysR family regulator